MPWQYLQEYLHTSALSCRKEILPFLLEHFHSPEDSLCQAGHKQYMKMKIQRRLWKKMSEFAKGLSVTVNYCDNTLMALSRSLLLLCMQQNVSQHLLRLPAPLLLRKDLNL